ncbi:MAG: PAS domain S-box protein [Gelidibacter sp.]
MPTYLVKIKDKLFQNIFDNAPNGIAIVGLDYKWVKVNRSLLELLGYSEEELYAMTFPEITHKDDLELALAQKFQLLERHIDRYQIKKRFFHKTGRIIWVLSSVSLVFHDDGTPLYFISQVVDISEHKELLLQMNSLAEIAKDQNEKLKDFAHIATHDIRSHLGNLNMIAGFMEEELPCIKNDDNFNMLKVALAQLDTTISNLNEVRKDQFSAQESLTALNLNDFVANNIYNISAIARHEQCEIINTVDENLQVLAVPVYLDSVILNLLTNAIKYRSEKRRAFVHLRTIVSEDYVILEVSDNGLGIDLDTHRHDLFQFKKTFHHRQDSIGIGLFITKNHVESMGGKIEVQSKVDVGSTFRLFFRKPKADRLNEKCHK